MVNEAAPTFVCASFAVHVTVVVPRPKRLLEAGEQFTGTPPSTRSDAVGFVKVTREPSGPSASITMGAGTPVSTGGVVSRTVTVNVALPVLPWESVALHVTVVEPNANVLPEAREQLGASEPETRSLADAEKVTTAPAGPVASAVIGPGTATVGGVVSLTVTSNEAEPVLPDESVALHVTVVVPRGNVLPEPGEQLTEMLPSKLSVADAENVTTAPDPPVASTVMGAGTDTVGGTVSFDCTVTVNEALPVLPWESVAVHVTVVVPRGNVLPEAGEQLGVSEPETRSLADAENVTTVPAGLLVAVVIAAGTVTEGGVVSTTATSNDFDAVAPVGSLAVHVTFVTPRGKVEPESGEQVTGTVPAVSEVAVGAGHVSVAPADEVASTVWSSGMPWIWIGGGSETADGAATSATKAKASTLNASPRRNACPPLTPRCTDCHRNRECQAPPVRLR